MRDPTRIKCDALAQVPTAQELGALASEHPHVSLQFPDEVDTDARRGLIKELSSALSEHTVFDNGRGITIMKVIDRATVMERADAIIDAALAFRHLADRLCRELAQRAGIDPDRLIDCRVDDVELDEGWTYRFHGFECEFRSRGRNPQILDVQICFGEEFGVLDPYFFTKFLRTTKQFRRLALLFPDDFHDMRRALEVLEEDGRLHRISLAKHLSGVFAP